MATEEKNDTEDATLKKNKKNFKKGLQTFSLIILLVLIADLCILLALNKVGVIDINDKIDNIPGINLFTNNKVQEKNDSDKEKSNLIEIESLQKQLQIKEADLNAITTQRDKLAEKNKVLEEELMKIQSEKKGTEKIVQYYSKMKPKQAAEALNKINAETIMEILGGMPEGTAATILDKMLPEKVAEITEKQEEKKK